MTCGHDDSTINIVMGIIIIIITTTVQNSTIQDQDSNPRVQDISINNSY